MNMSETAKSMVEKVGYPYKIFEEGTPYEKIMNEYDEELKRGKAEGFIPIIVPVDYVLDDFFGDFDNENYSVQNMLKLELESGKKILDERFEEYTGQNEEDFEMDLDEFIGDYDGEPDVMSEYVAFIDYSTGKCQETIIFEIPTDKPWELVAYIPFGGWNECPEVEKMMAICKYWYEKYGAVPVTISHDVLEMSLPAPVGSDLALEVAKEHYAFTPDRVDQGTQTGTLSEVAASVAVSDKWFFWWD